MDRRGPDRALLRGLGEEILFLVVQHASPAQLTAWLKLPLEFSPGDAEFLYKPNECCQLRRKGEQILSIVMERASPRQWFKWLQIPLEHAQRAGQSSLVKQLLGAGGGGWPAAAGAAGPTETGTTAGCCAASAQTAAEGGAGWGGFSFPDALFCSTPPREDTPDVTPVSPCCAVPPSVAAAFSSCAAGPSALPGERPEVSASSAPRTPAVARGGVLPASDGGDDLPIIRAGGAAALVDEDKLCLHRATMARDLVRMRELLAGGVDGHATDLWSCTALHRAAEQDDAEPVRLLLAAGLDVGARDMEGYSPLHFAAARGAETAIVDLLAAGACLADRGLNGDTPLHSAVRFLSLATVRILLESDADETAKNEDGHTPREVTGVLPDGREIESQPDPLTAQGILALLAAAPARRKFRIWKRRAWLVLLRARAQARALTTAANVVAGVDGADASEDDPTGEEKLEKTLRCNVGKCCVGGGTRGVGSGGGVLQGKCEAVDSVFLDLVEHTTELAEDGVFQKIVRYL